MVVRIWLSNGRLRVGLPLGRRSCDVRSSAERDHDILRDGFYGLHRAGRAAETLEDTRTPCPNALHRLTLFAGSTCWPACLPRSSLGPPRPCSSWLVLGRHFQLLLLIHVQIAAVAVSFSSASSTAHVVVLVVVVDADALATNSCHDVVHEPLLARRQGAVARLGARPPWPRCGSPGSRRPARSTRRSGPAAGSPAGSASARTRAGSR